MATSTPAHIDLGRQGEALAERYLTRRGLVVLDRNWRSRGGEIDLVLRDNDVVVICEVKTRSSTVCGSPHEALTPVKVARLRRLAAAWLAEHRVRPRGGVRLDLVAVLGPVGGPWRIEHVPGVE